MGSHAAESSNRESARGAESVPKRLPIRRLIDACLDGKGPCPPWEELVSRSDPHAWGYARRCLVGLGSWQRNGLEAEDVAGEVWLRLLRNDARGLRGFEGTSDGQWFLYLKKVVLNTVLDARRKSDGSTMPPMTTMGPEELMDVLNNRADNADSPSKQYESTEARERFEKALLDTWSGKETCSRDIFICQLYFLLDYSAPQIAGIPTVRLRVKQVEKIVERARKIIRDHMGGPGARSASLDDGSPWPKDPGSHFESDEQVQQFVFDAIDEDTRARQFSHLVQCAQCRERVATVLDTWNAPLSDEERKMYETEGPGRDDARVASVMARLESESVAQPAIHRGGRAGRQAAWSRPRRWALLSVAAVVVLAVGLTLRPSLVGESPYAVQSPLGQLRFGDSFHFPLTVSAPLRLAQEFTAEPNGWLRGEEDDVSRTQAHAAIRVAERELRREMGASADMSVVERVAYLNALGHLKLARGRLQLASQEYAAALALDPADAVALVGLAVVEFQWAEQEGQAAVERQDRLRRADEYLSQVPSNSRHYGRALFNRIEVALQRGDVELAASLVDVYENLDVDAESPWQRTASERVRGARSD